MRQARSGTEFIAGKQIKLLLLIMNMNNDDSKLLELIILFQMRVKQKQVKKIFYRL